MSENICTTCKWWRCREVAQEDFSGVGECRRHPPRPTFENVAGLLSLLSRRGSIALKDEADGERDGVDVTSWTDVTTTWPVTLGEDFCGEHVARARPGFV